MKKNNLFYALLIILAITISSCEQDEKDPEPEVEIDETLDKGLSFKGLWNSTTPSATFQDVAISMKVEDPNDLGNYQGNLWISNNFTSCCGSGESDGGIRFTIAGDSVLNFVYTDVIPGCEGTFRGEGTIDADMNLIIAITGNDCDGDHIGELTFSIF